MPRRARLALGGVPWHIIQRGNNRSLCFYSEQDYLRYLDYLIELSHEHKCFIHAYVLMSNHVHLLLTPMDAEGPGLLMKNLGQRYVQYINRNYERTGTLWEGRYKSSLVDTDQYVLACYRYIEMNPVRAGMVQHPADYRWSSYRANAQSIGDPVIVPHDVFLELGASCNQRKSAYRSLFESEINTELIDEIRAAANSNYALGNNQFRAEVERRLNKRASPGKPGRPRAAN